MAEEKQSAVRPSRLWRSVLVISLALNLAVVGLVIGLATSGRLGDGPPRSFSLGLGPVSQALEPEERHRIGRRLREDRNLRDLDLRSSANQMVATLREEPFDPDAFRALLDEQTAQMAAFRAVAQTAALEQIVRMTPERRQAFADQLMEELSKEKPSRERNSGG
ncbi:heavy-metal resistance protein [Yoonia maricola]|uniref:Heavy-metal resistance protein n=1 Tax=Yoonia maricola TaxID=420999 RepID=A0A2M8W285_9RHOB|nr:periplasmic heavy metal sensor [Yoonia maricola]PJI85029.1 heavy-metal resistance protein [Yoonia maricola]